MPLSLETTEATGYQKQQKYRSGRSAGLLQNWSRNLTVDSKVDLNGKLTKMTSNLTPSEDKQ